MREAIIRLENDDDLKKLEHVAREAGISCKIINRIKKEYTLKSSRYYLGSDALYRETLYFIRQYPEYQRILADMQQESIGVQYKIGGRGSQVSRPTENKAVNRAELQRRINIIDRAIETVPIDYRQGVWDHVIYQTKYTEDGIFFYAHVNTWKQWTQRFVYEVAIRRGYGSLIEQLKR
ncbi:hypothetical protein ACDL92_11880 [Ihubacter sp. mB4P-1]|uniref:hypothetical protein n=1 Tax=Ihubacter sp. mB4P-1 TaxID=3242370 RepID=UPI00216C2F6D|nr:hypothetical protein [Emergencia sp.]